MVVEIVNDLGRLRADTQGSRKTSSEQLIRRQQLKGCLHRIRNMILMYK